MNITREEWLTMREDDFTIMYTYYLNNLNKSEKKIQLSPQQFAQAFMMWENNMTVLIATKVYYDALFNILTIHTGKKTIYA